MKPLPETVKQVKEAITSTLKACDGIRLVAFIKDGVEMSGFFDCTERDKMRKNGWVENET